ncbi:MAG TPA: carbohydrate ABC transporter permease [Candidatus Hungatella pullicola]|nr:carbohydrate ABC transporter permease [Candidatus Hungatella pullicola]
MSNNTFGRNKIIKTIAYLVLGIYTILVAYPLLFMVFTSFKTNEEFFVNLFLPPQHMEVSNYVNAWNVGKIGLYFKNSVFVTAVSVLVTTVVSLMGGYALAKLHIPKADLIMDGFMVFNFIPGIAIYIALYTMIRDMNMSGGYLSLILPYIAWQIPFSMYIIKQYFATIPQELIESGRIDGCTEFQTFLHIMLPLVKPAVATIVVFTFIGNWGELMWANIATASNVSIKTLPVGLLNFKTEMGVEWGQYTAGICLVTIPLMIIFGYFQKYFVSGLTNGAVKG